MLLASIVLFIIAMIIGAIVLTTFLKNQPRPKRLVYLHGILALSALTLLIIYLVSGHRDPYLIASVAVFAAGSLGGLNIFRLDVIQHKHVPKSWPAGHGFIHFIAFVLLMIYVYKNFVF